MGDSGKLVSVIMPAYNAALYIENSIRTILDQTYPYIELIVVNDGSTDKTEEIVKKFKDQNIKLISQLNKGQSAACNAGFSASSGELIKFFDADDILNPKFIEHQVNALAGSVDCIASAKWGRFFNDDLQTFKLNTEVVWKDMIPIDWLIEAFESGSNMMQCALWLIPRPVLLKSGLWKEELSLNNDFDFFVRVLLNSNNIKFCENSILYYRSGNSNTLSQQKNRPAYQSAINSNFIGTDTILNFENTERTRVACAKNLTTWMFETYPAYKDLSKMVEQKIRSLASINVSYPSNRKLVVFCSRIFGWKFIRQIGAVLK